MAEHKLPKLGVAGSSPVARSSGHSFSTSTGLFFYGRLHRPYIEWESMYEKVGSARFFYCLLPEESSRQGLGLKKQDMQIERPEGVNVSELL